MLLIFKFQEILGAGTDTTASTMEWAMSEMIKNPRVMKKAQEEARRVLQGKKKTDIEDCIQDLNYLKLVIKETLRLHPPTSLLLRESIGKCKIGEHEIPAGAIILVNAYAINRSLEWWSEDAHCFKPERFVDFPINYNGNAFHFISFGTGRRVCAGISFANATMELVLGLLLCHFDWELPGGAKYKELDMNNTFGISTKRKNNLYLIATPIPSLDLGF